MFENHYEMFLSLYKLILSNKPLISLLASLRVLGRSHLNIREDLGLAKMSIFHSYLKCLSHIGLTKEGTEIKNSLGHILQVCHMAHNPVNMIFKKIILKV